MKMQKKSGLEGGGGVRSGGGRGGKGGCVRRIEVVKMPIKSRGSDRGVRVDEYVELKLLGVVGGRGLVGSKVGGSG